MTLPSNDSLAHTHPYVRTQGQVLLTQIHEENGCYDGVCVADIKINNHLLQMMAFVVDFNGSKKLYNLGGACTRIHDEIHKNREQLYRH